MINKKEMGLKPGQMVQDMKDNINKDKKMVKLIIRYRSINFTTDIYKYEFNIP